MKRYTTTAIVLHWLMALLILAMLTLGHYMHDLKLSPLKLQLYSYHKWAGVSLLLLAVLRIVWRLTHKPPELVLPCWQQVASSSVHGLLYLLFIAMPLSGWLMSSAKGIQTIWFGLIPLPDMVEKNEALGHLLGKVHGSLSSLLLLLIGLHIAAALKHQFIDRDQLLCRILPGKSSKGKLP